MEVARHQLRHRLHEHVGKRVVELRRRDVAHVDLHPQPRVEDPVHARLQHVDQGPVLHHQATLVLADDDALERVHLQHSFHVMGGLAWPLLAPALARRELPLAGGLRSRHVDLLLVLERNRKEVGGAPRRRAGAGGAPGRGVPTAVTIPVLRGAGDPSPIVISRAGRLAMARESGARGRVPRCAKRRDARHGRGLGGAAAPARERLPVWMLSRTRAAESNRGAFALTS